MKEKLQKTAIVRLVTEGLESKQKVDSFDCVCIQTLPDKKQNFIGNINYRNFKNLLKQKDWDRLTLAKDEDSSIFEFCRLVFINNKIRPEIASVFMDSYNPTNLIYIDKVFVPKRIRGRGHGSELINLFLKKTSNSSNLIVLDACAYESVEELKQKSELLCTWYSGLGFIRIPGTNFMIYSAPFQKLPSKNIGTIWDGERCLKCA